MENLISSDTIGCVIAFLAFALGMTALAKAWLDGRRGAPRETFPAALLQRQADLGAPHRHRIVYFRVTP